MAYKRILTIQDISCVGQCSMTVAMPILSACGHETCILPTAILSTHTGGFGRPVVQHLEVEGIWRHWQQQGITFDAILVGYLGSIRAVEIVSEILDSMVAPGGISVVDPAMADHGKLYSGFDEAYAEAMKRLCKKSDIMLPNVTEAAMMTGLPYREELTEDYVRQLLTELPGKDVVLTGVGFTPDTTGCGIRQGSGMEFVRHPKLGKSYSGTGDMFAACFTGALMQGKTMTRSAELAGGFICEAISNTAADPAHWYGVKFETALPWLMEKLFL